MLLSKRNDSFSVDLPLFVIIFTMNSVKCFLPRLFLCCSIRSLDLTAHPFTHFVDSTNCSCFLCGLVSFTLPLLSCFIITPYMFVHVRFELVFAFLSRCFVFYSWFVGLLVFSELLRYYCYSFHIVITNIVIVIFFVIVVSLSSSLVSLHSQSFHFFA